MHKAVLLCVLVIVALLVTSATSASTENIVRSLEKIRDRALDAIKNHELKKAYSKCLANQGAAAKDLKNADTRCNRIFGNIEKNKGKLDTLTQEIDALKKAIKESLKKCGEDDEKLRNEIEKKLRLINNLKIAVVRVSKKEHAQSKKKALAKLLGLLENLALMLKARLLGLGKCPTADGLNAQLAKKEQELEATKKLLKGLLNDHKQCKKQLDQEKSDLKKAQNDCGAIKKKLDALVKKLLEEIKDAEEIIKLINGQVKKTVGDGKSAGDSWKAVEKDLKDLLKQLKKELAQLKNPSPNCATKRADNEKKLRDIADALDKIREHIKDIEGRIPGLKKELDRLRRKLADLTGRLAEVSKKCRALEKTDFTDLAEELAGIDEIIALVKELIKTKQLSSETGNKILATFQKIRDELAAKLKNLKAETLKAIKTCRNLEDKLKKEIDNTKAVIARLDADLKNSLARLSSLRDRKKVLLGSKASTSKVLANDIETCKKLADQYKKDKSNLNRLITVLTRISAEASEAREEHTF